MPRKLGQHFLTRESVLASIAAAVCDSNADRVVEIGPGRGALTRHLLPLVNELHAIELDRSLVAYLQSKFSGESKLHIHPGDVLSTDLAQWGDAVVCGNLPYYITSPIIEQFLRLPSAFVRAVFLMQWEVAERLLALPGSRDYGYLTVAVRLVCEAKLVLKVPPAAFAPPPMVDSAVLRFNRHPQALGGREKLLQFVSRCFAQKRKMLRNNLRPFYGAAIDQEPEATLRAEQLSIAAFTSLFERLEGQSA